MSKNPYKTNFGVSIDVLPFSENKFRFDRLTLDEIIGGELATGEVNLFAVDTEYCDKYLLTQNSVHIKIKQDDSKKEYNIYGYIMDRVWSPNSGSYYFKFVCIPLKGSNCDQEFFSVTRTKRYKNPRKAIEGAWGDKERIRFECETDLGDIDIFQDRESNYTFLKKLCYSYKMNTIFGFDFDGLFIKDLFGIDRVTKEQEPSRVIVSDSQVQSEDEINMTYNYDLYRKIENPVEDESGDSTTLSKNFDVEVMNDQYRIYRKDTTQYQRNSKYNRRLMDSTMSTGLVVRFTNKLPPFQLGDTINHCRAYDEKTPEGKFGSISTYLVSRIYFYISARPEQKEDGETFLVKAIFRGVEDSLGNKLSYDDKKDPGTIGLDFNRV